MGLPGTELLPGRVCASLSLAGPGPRRHTSSPGCCEGGEGHQAVSQLPGDRGLLPCFLLSSCEGQNTEASFLYPGSPSLRHRPEQRTKTYQRSSAGTTANPRQCRQKEETDISPLLYNILGFPSALALPGLASAPSHTQSPLYLHRPSLAILESRALTTGVRGHMESKYIESTLITVSTE